MNEVDSSTNWWSRKYGRLPVWAWVVIVFAVVGAIGSGNRDSTTTRVPSEPSEATSAPNPTTSSTVVVTTTTYVPTMTMSQQNAVKEALSYLDSLAFSRQGLIDQLSSQYGSQFPRADAKFAVEVVEKYYSIDWNEQAVKAARSYLDSQSFSCQGLIDQLSSQYGSQFTREEATYGANSVGLC